MRPLVLVVASFALLALPAPAAGQARWADPAVTDDDHSCAADDPCRVEDAIEDAVTGARVILKPGEYAISSTLVAPGPITLEGEPGQPRPRLVGATNLSTAVLEFKEGGTLRHLAVVARGNGSDALTLRAASAEGLDLFSASGDGAKLVGDPSTTVLRDSVVRAEGVGGSIAGVKLRDGGEAGDVALRNVTVVSTGAGSTAVRCETSVGRSTLLNVIARGEASDVDAAANASRCEVWHSNLRPFRSPGLSPHPTNQDADPLLVDPANGDLRVASGSPVVDAGATDPFVGSTDPEGRARVLGAAPDIGAYEHAGLPSSGPVPVVPTGAGGGGTAGEGGELPPGLLPPTTPPAPHRAVVIRTEAGTVAVRVPGAPGYVTLGPGANVPLGSLVDTRRGKVRLESATDADGGSQSGVFHGGVFRVRQTAGARPYTELVLAGGDFSRCPRRRGVALAAARRKAVRKLWGSDRGGRFRTRGRSSSATVRGTEWLTEDLCAGTRVRVRSGAVDVRPKHGGAARRVRAGRSLLVRLRGR